MKDMGSMRLFLGIRVEERPERIYMTQTAYIDKIVDLFDMIKVKVKRLLLSHHQGK